MSKTQGGHRFIEGDTETVQKFKYDIRDSGSAARFFKVCPVDADDGAAAMVFYGPKPRRSDRGPTNRHPTVKSTALMRYLCRLVTQPGGTVLDPFMGSGSTGKAAAAEGFSFVGIEQDPAYFEVSKARVSIAYLSRGTPTQ